MYLDFSKKKTSIAPKNYREALSLNVAFISVGLKLEDKLELHATVGLAPAIFPVQHRIAPFLKMNIL